MEMMLLPFKRYADFSGRSRRKEYWMWTLLQMIVVMVLYAMIMLGVPWAEIAARAQADQMGVLYTGAEPVPGIGFYIGITLLLVWILATFIPSLAVTIRRLHDQDKSGWFYLLSFVPFGGLVLLVFFCLEGTRGPNQYGPDPLADDRATFA